MKHNQKKSIEVHNELRLNVDEQQSGIDDAEEVLEITAARNPKKKNKPVSVTCNQTLAMKNWVKKIIRKQNTDLW